MDKIETKSDLLKQLRSLADNPDDDVIHYKKLIKQHLLNCPELLYSFHDPELEPELFDEDGNLCEDGDWGLYFGHKSHIRDYISFPDVQTESRAYVCYTVSFKEEPRYNSIEKYLVVTFTIFVHNMDNYDKETGIPRHDLLGSIIRTNFNWSNLLGAHLRLDSNVEGSADNSYVTRTLVFKQTTTNSLVETQHGETGFINKPGLRKVHGRC